MAVFTQHLWEDGRTQYPGRRKLTNISTGVEKTVLVNREEGEIIEKGDQFEAASLNNLELRLATAFGELENQMQNMAALINLYYPVGKIFMSLKDFGLDVAGHTMFPGTTWQRLKDGKILIPNFSKLNESYNTRQQNFKLEGSVVINNSQSTFVQSHVCTVDEMTKHKHKLANYKLAENVLVASYEGNYYGAGGTTYNEYFYEASEQTSNVANASVGNGHTHNINLRPTFAANTINLDTVQKSIKVYAWRRTS